MKSSSRMQHIVLFEKSGAEGTYRAFKHFIGKTVKTNNLPDYHFHLEESKTSKEPSLRMTKRDAVAPETRISRPATYNSSSHLTDATIARIRKEFAGWDIYALKAEFDTWVSENPGKKPDNYEAAFYGFVKKYHERNKYQL